MTFHQCIFTRITVPVCRGGGEGGRRGGGGEGGGGGGEGGGGRGGGGGSYFHWKEHLVNILSILCCG